MNNTPTNRKTRRFEGWGSTHTSAKINAKKKNVGYIWYVGRRRPKTPKMGNCRGRHTEQVRKGQGKVRRRKSRQRHGNTTRQGAKDERGKKRAHKTGKREERSRCDWFVVLIHAADLLPCQYVCSSRVLTQSFVHTSQTVHRRVAWMA